MVCAALAIRICSNFPQDFKMMLSFVSVNYNANNDVKTIAGTGSSADGILNVKSEMFL